MRNYSMVSPRFWFGETGKKIRRLGTDGQTLALYLLTCPNSTMLGVYYLPLTTMWHEIGSPLQGALEGLTSPLQGGFCVYDYISEYVWVKKMAFFQVGDEIRPNDNRIKGLNAAYQALPDLPFLGDFFDMYKDHFHLQNKRENRVYTAEEINTAGSELSTTYPHQKSHQIGKPLTSPLQAPYKPLLSQEQEQEQEQEQYDIDIPRKSHDAFDAFWQTYPRKVGKQAAKRAWKTHKGDSLLEIILADLTQRSADPQWHPDNPFVPHPTTYLNQHRWQDEQKIMPQQGVKRDHKKEAADKLLDDMIAKYDGPQNNGENQ